MLELNGYYVFQAPLDVVAKIITENVQTVVTSAIFEASSLTSVYLESLATRFTWTYSAVVDEPYFKQYGFQDPATTFFEKLIDFHHDMLFLMIVVLVFVFYMLMSCIFNFNQWSGSLPSVDVRYNAKIETIWTVVPTLILLMVVVPAFSLIYSMDDTSSQPMFSVKIAGNQWYWTYEYVFLKSQASKTSSVESLPFPYVVDLPNSKYTLIYPNKWNISTSKKWHDSNNDFKMHIHILENGLPTLNTAEEWVNFHIFYYNLRKCAKVLTASEPILDKVKGSHRQYDIMFASQLLKSFNTVLPRIDEYLSFKGSKHNTGFDILRAFANEDSFWTFESTKLSKLNLKAYSYDSTMLGEDDVLSSKGTKARLLSVDKPLYLPANTLLTVAVTAYDVIHSWTVPSFGVKLDGCPGRSNTVSFSVKRPGIYYGQCSEICGVNHAFMPIEVRVLTLNDFLTHITKWK